MRFLYNLENDADSTAKFEYEQTFEKSAKKDHVIPVKRFALEVDYILPVQDPTEENARVTFN